MKLSEMPRDYPSLKALVVPKISENTSLKWMYRHLHILAILLKKYRRYYCSGCQELLCLPYCYKYEELKGFFCVCPSCFITQYISGVLFVVDRDGRNSMKNSLVEVESETK